MNIKTISIDKLSFSYSDFIKTSSNLLVIKDLTMEIKEGETICLFGPNGCGKSTLLRLLTGLIKPISGSMKILGMEPEYVNPGYIPQSFSESLFPWLKGIDNIAFPLYMSNFSRKDARERAIETAKSLSKNLPLDRYPYELSIGQKQLVSLSRALVTNPSVLFADEPYSALDFNARIEIQQAFQKVLDPQNNISSVLVSHQIEDAVYMGDKVFVMSNLPMKILHIFDVPSKRPRIQSFKKSKEFLDLVIKITRVFMQSN